MCLTSADFGPTMMGWFNLFKMGNLYLVFSNRLFECCANNNEVSENFFHDWVTCFFCCELSRRTQFFLKITGKNSSWLVLRLNRFYEVSLDNYRWKFVVFNFELKKLKTPSDEKFLAALSGRNINLKQFSSLKLFFFQLSLIRIYKMVNDFAVIQY